jgi:hypothetical protein
LADETINRVILKISEENIENKLAYCYGVAKNVYRESLRKELNHLDIDEIPLAAKTPAEQSFSGECLDKCLAELSPESRNLILDYFSEVKQAKIELHRRISERLEMTDRFAYAREAHQTEIEDLRAGVYELRNKLHNARS